MTQVEVAAALCCTPATYCRYEEGTRVPPIDEMISLSKILKVSVDIIIGNNITESIQLSDFEIALVNASREVSAQVRQDALEFLQVKSVSNASDTSGA